MVRTSGSEPEDASALLERTKGDGATADRGGGSGRERRWGEKEKNPLRSRVAFDRVILSMAREACQL